MSGTYPVQASTLRVGGYVMISGHPCRITKMTTHKTGKHGHAKVSLTGIDIFTGTKHELLVSSTHNVDVPNIKRSEYQLVDIDDDFLSLMEDSGEMKEDVRLPPQEELATSLQKDFEEGKELVVTVLAALDKEQVISYKESR